VSEAELKRDALVNMSSIEHGNEHLAFGQRQPIALEDTCLGNVRRDTACEQFGKQQAVTLRQEDVAVCAENRRK
jgi:hypothetical protein